MRKKLIVEIDESEYDEFLRVIIQFQSVTIKKEREQ